MRDLTLVFDLDGTLIDTAPDLLAATNHALSTLSLGPADAGAIRPKISHGALAMIKAGLATHGATCSQRDLDALLGGFLDYYAANISRGSRPFAGIEAALARYADAGTRLAVCTNKREDLSRLLLGNLLLGERFHAIAGRETFPVCKPDPAHLIGAIKLAGGRTDRAIMVGDSDTDIKTANAAGIPIIGVTFGYSDPPMEALSPTVMITSYADFDAAVTQMQAIERP